MYESFFYFAADCPLESASAGEQTFPPAIRIFSDPPHTEILGNRDGMSSKAARPVPPTQHCLIVTREQYVWNSTRMKNWRDLYPAP